MSFTLRPAVIGDVEELAQLHVATWKEAYAELLPASFFTDEFLDSRRGMWNHVIGLGNPLNTIRVAETDGRLIGFAMAGPPIVGGEEKPPRDRLLYMIYTLAQHYGTGLGQALLDEVLGDSPAMLRVAKANPRAQAFYRRNGFTFDGHEQFDPAWPLLVDQRWVR